MLPFGVNVTDIDARTGGRAAEGGSGCTEGGWMGQAGMPRCEREVWGTFEGSEISPFPASFQGWANAAVGGLWGRRSGLSPVNWGAGGAGGPRLVRLVLCSTYNHTVDYFLLLRGTLRDVSLLEIGPMNMLDSCIWFRHCSMHSVHTRICPRGTPTDPDEPSAAQSRSGTAPPPSSRLISSRTSPAQLQKGNPIPTLTYFITLILHPSIPHQGTHATRRMEGRRYGLGPL